VPTTNVPTTNVPTTNAAIAALCTDLIFTSKITEVARTLGVTCHGARDVESLLARTRRHAAEAPIALVIVDMVLRDADAAVAIRALRADPSTRAARIVAFLPHERDDLRDAATAAGATSVLTRGQLAKQLPRLIGGE
jgi:CheY-like chemotaxis protein